MARAPVAGRCKTRLAPTLGAGGAARLYAAMLGDTLDGLARAGAWRLVVLAAPGDFGVATLRRIAHEPWTVIAQEGDDRASWIANAFQTLGAHGGPLILARCDVPMLPFAALADAMGAFGTERGAIVGPCDNGTAYVVGMSGIEPGILRDIPPADDGRTDVVGWLRAQCLARKLPLIELPSAHHVERAEDVERLRLELAAHPERAPRTATFLRESPP